MSHKAIDLLVLGSGPAGLSAGIYGGAERMKVHILERSSELGGQIRFTAALENLAGFPYGITGKSFVNRAYKQAKRMGAEFNDSVSIDRVERLNGRFLAYSGSTLVADSRAVLLATGVEFNTLPSIPQRHGVHYGHVLNTGSEARAVVVVGGGNSAGQAIVHLAQKSTKVTVVVRGDSLHKSMSAYLVERIKHLPNVKVLFNSNVVELEGSKASLTGVRLDTGVNIPASHVYVYVGQKPVVTPFPDVQHDSDGYIVVDQSLATNIPGVFAAGDAKHFGLKRVSVAVADGAIVVNSVWRMFNQVNEFNSH